MVRNKQTLKKIDLQLLNSLNSTNLFSLKSSMDDNPIFIIDNLKHKLRDYQMDAIHHLDTVMNMKDADSHNQLMFYMATGSGKTDIMAATILYLYQIWHYQCFLFTTNTTAVVEKTIDNLVNDSSAKYLYTESIVINGDPITIKQVNSYPVNLEKNTIYIKFSGIQQLSNDYYAPRENGITKDSLARHKLVILADEAHHFNTNTRRSKKANQESLSWEKLLDEIRELNPKNKQLEFTATIDLHNLDIYNKYKDKIIAKYDLSNFIRDGYSKNVFRLQANNSDENKMLNAVLLSQYRKRIAKNLGIPDFKPVILFKSNTVAQSKEINEKFLSMIDGLSAETLQQFIQRQNRSTQSEALGLTYKYWLNQDFATTVTELKRDFNKFTTINANDSGTKDILDDETVSGKLNSLENSNNPIRSVFAVAKLSEGWDVLNLYDIVRIGEKNINQKETNAEAQLIGRGARYNPFLYHGKRSYKRRFDDRKSKIQLLERLYYHTINDPKYLENLKKSLDAIDLPVDEDIKYKIYTAKVKSSFKQSKIYTNGNIYYNKTINVPESHYDSIRKYDFDPENAGPIDMMDVVSERSYNTGADKNNTIESTLEIAARFGNDEDKALIRTAISCNDFFRFNSLKHYCPTLTSIREFLTSDAWLGKAIVRVRVATNASKLTKEQQLTAVKKYLTRVQKAITSNFRRSIGTNEFEPIAIKEVIKDYQKRVGNRFNSTVASDIGSDSMKDKAWYVYDYAIVDTLEKHFIDRINSIIPALSQQYGHVYLLRIDERTTDFKLHDFGKNVFHYAGYMPDFILYLEDTDFIYQLFLEPKGKAFVESDSWKEQFLEKINPQNIEVLDEDDKIKIYGLKFYVEDNGREDTHGLFKEMREKNILK
nr:DEAD/DEAH box helicase family protein [uncultured Ligilactobacillus sp.]